MTCRRRLKSTPTPSPIKRYCKRLLTLEATLLHGSLGKLSTALNIAGLEATGLDILGTVREITAAVSTEELASLGHFLGVVMARVGNNHVGGKSAGEDRG